MIIDTKGRIETTYKVIIEKKYNHPINKVWDAITESKHVSKWMEYNTDIELKIGGKYHVNFKKDGSLNGVIFILKPLKKLSYAWGETIVSWSLKGDEKKTEIIFSHNGLTSEKAVELGSGWEAFIDYLEPYLSEQPFPKNRHDFLLEKYTQMLKV